MLASGGERGGGGLRLSHSSIVPRRPDAQGRVAPGWPTGDGSTQGCAQGEGKGSRKEETPSQGEEASDPEETDGLDGKHCAGQPGMAWLRVLFCLQLLLWAWGSAQELDAAGRNVCVDKSVPAGLACCPGWRQEGKECTAAVCEGEDACTADEVCVKPGVCRCKPGFFGAHCSSRCPDQYWGPDCKQSCLCHPHGKCNPVTGQCTCHANRWGPLCQFPCPCGPHGHCHPLTGACLCEPGWWAPTCKRQCQCNLSGSRCDPATGQCLCAQGWWGRRCSLPCSCHLSPCAQDSGKCECKAGFWGLLCQHPCDCLHGSCSPVTGSCTCSPGYQGRSCRDPCPAGHYGPQCKHR
ncbi:scavenger receptor class F member 1-like [Alligator mississippiensis]|uniref:Scavenger receptor class F member 1-like n=1 Tax=Alligator mississippiensis TaxID=8496 RepID=A0A151P0C3_ALLMI|nr:scavenger receptor class F member 1-like [Alligator mississippiensis]